MAIRSTMSAPIQSVRILINDTLPVGNGQVFDDQTIQDVMDESREDVVNRPLQARPTYSGSTIQYLDYYSDFGGGFEDGMVLKQYLTVVVTPSTIEPIVGHFKFAANTFPPVFITGLLHDRYRASADLLERLAAKWVLSYDVLVGGQQFKRSQATDMILKLAKSYRLKQRPCTINMTRSDLGGSGQSSDPTAPTNIDYYASGSKQG